MRALPSLLAALLACGALSCGAGDDDPQSDGLAPGTGGTPGGGGGSFDGGVVAPGGAFGGGSPGAGGGGAIPGGGTGGGPVVLPPEQELEVPFEAPQAGKTTVYVPNPGTHRVAAVNATTFAIETLPSGLGPTYAA